MDSNDKKCFVLTKKEYQFINNLEENLKSLSLRQYKQAKQDCDLYEAMRTLTVDDLKAIIWMNLIKKTW